MGKINNKKIIGFDLDGVIINHAPAKIKLAKELGFKFIPRQTQSEIIKTQIDDKTLKQIQIRLYHDSRFFKSTPLMKGAKSGLMKLKKNNLPFVLISRRGEPEIAMAALKYHGLWPKFFNKNNTFFVLEPEDKNIKGNWDTKRENAEDTDMEEKADEFEQFDNLLSLEHSL